MPAEWITAIQIIVSGSVDVQGHRAMALAPCMRSIMYGTAGLIVVASTRQDTLIMTCVSLGWLLVIGNFIYTNILYANSKKHPFEMYDLMREALQQGKSAGDLAKIASALQALDTRKSPEGPQPGPQPEIPAPDPATIMSAPKQKQLPSVPPTEPPRPLADTVDDKKGFSGGEQGESLPL